MTEQFSEPAISVIDVSSLLLWCVIACLALTGRTSLGPIEVLFLLAPLVHVPLGLRVIRPLSGGFSRFGITASRLLPAGAIAAALSFWPHTGFAAGLLAGGWLFICLLLAAEGLLFVFRRGYRSFQDICISVGLCYLAVGGVWLVLSRSGATPMHFAEPIILLTAVHFHFTGFALPVIAAATGHSLATRAPYTGFASLFPYVAAGIVGGPAILAGGFVFGYPLWKLVAAMFLAAICVVLAVLILLAVPRVKARAAQVLLCISAASLTFGMVLAGAFVIGDFTQRYWLLIPRMARLHGTANALGFALCGLIGWVLAARQAPGSASPTRSSGTNYWAASSEQPGRTVAAFLLAPLIVPLIFFAVSVLQDAYSSGAFPTGGSLDVLMILTLYGLPCAYLTELILGVPVWFVFKHYKIRSFTAFAAGGAFLGFVFYAFWEGLPGDLTIQSLAREFNPFSSGALPGFVISASVSAILFRAIAFPGAASQALRDSR
jgi:YndJ-like protein